MSDNDDQKESRTLAFQFSEQYAALRMPHLKQMGAKLNEVSDEIVHDALMAAYQAGALGVSEDLSVAEAVHRVQPD